MTDYRTVYGIRGDEIVAVVARPVPGGWLVKQGCFRSFVEAEKISETRESAEARLQTLEPA